MSHKPPATAIFVVVPLVTALLLTLFGSASPAMARV
jgi:hypothetical protein